jgi:hypothetical protein
MVGATPTDIPITLLTSRRQLEAWRTHISLQSGRSNREPCLGTGILRLLALLFAMGSSRQVFGRAIARPQLVEILLAASCVVDNLDWDSGLKIEGGKIAHFCIYLPSPLSCGCLYF